MCTFKETVQIDFMQSYKKFTLQNLKSSRQSCRHLSDGLKKSDISFSSKLSDEQIQGENICNSFFTFLLSIIRIGSYIKNLNF